MTAAYNGELPGVVVAAVYSLDYRVEDQDVSSSGGLELIVGDGSILFWSGTDWTLRAERGQWPTLPTWAWPPGAWNYVRIGGFGTPGLSEIVSADWQQNQVGETVGLILQFAGGTLRVRSGADFTWNVDVTRVT